MDGKSLQVEGVQKPTELLVSQVLTKKKEQHKEKKQSKVVGWFTEDGGERTHAGVQRCGRRGAMEEHLSGRN